MNGVWTGMENMQEIAQTHWDLQLVIVLLFGVAVIFMMCRLVALLVAIVFPLIPRKKTSVFALR